MGDLTTTISTAITLTRRLLAISKKIEDAEFNNLLGDLNIELGAAKVTIAELLQQNADLQNQLREAKAVEFDPCPRCRKRAWRIESSKPDKIFGDLGTVRREMACTSCGYTESILVEPS